MKNSSPISTHKVPLLSHQQSDTKLEPQTSWLSTQNLTKKSVAVAKNVGFILSAAAMAPLNIVLHYCAQANICKGAFDKMILSGATYLTRNYPKTHEKLKAIKQKKEESIKNTTHFLMMPNQIMVNFLKRGFNMSVKNPLTSQKAWDITRKAFNLI